MRSSYSLRFCSTNVDSFSLVPDVALRLLERQLRMTITAVCRARTQMGPLKAREMLLALRPKVLGDKVTEAEKSLRAL